MQIAILLTSNDKSDFAKRYPDDGEKFVALLRPLRPDWTFKVYPIIDGIFPDSITDYDGIVITGSPASVHDEEVWITKLLVLIRQAHHLQKPMVGACFGHQAIALALGGSVGKNHQDWVLGTADTSYHTSQVWMTPSASTLTLYAAHKEQVIDLPSEATTIGHTPGCSNSAFVIGNHIMTTQYHPEMTLDFMDELLDEMGDLISTETAKRARQLYSKGEQGKVFAQWMVAFFEAERTDQSRS